MGDENNEALNSLKNAAVEAESSVENFKAELAALEGAEEKDAGAIKSKKAELKTAEANLKKANAAVTKEETRLKREAEKAEKKAQREAEQKERAAKREAEKAAKKAEREAKAKAREEEKARKKAEKEANRMPEQNDVRRPKPETKCGQVWSIADNVSRELGQPVPIKTLLEHTNKAGLNEGNVKAEYARWRKFNGVIGRVTLPKVEESQGTEAA